MANKVTSGLLKSAFGSATQKGPPKGEGSGDTQHGALANAKSAKKVPRTKGQPGAQKQAPIKPMDDGMHNESRNGEGEKVKAAKPPKKAGDHDTKKILPVNDYGLHDMSKNGAKMEAPMDKVMRHAHQAKVRATRDWIEGSIDSGKHDEIHRRANSVIKTKGRRP